MEDNYYSAPGPNDYDEEYVYEDDYDPEYDVEYYDTRDRYFDVYEVDPNDLR